MTRQASQPWLGDGLARLTRAEDLYPAAGRNLLQPYCLRGMKPEGPGWFGCGTLHAEPVTEMELRPLAARFAW